MFFLTDDNIHLWYRVFWYVLSGVALSSAGLALLRYRLAASQPDGAAESRRFSRVDIAIGGIIVTGLAALLAFVTAFAYMGLLDIDDAALGNRWYLAFWCGLTVLAGLSGGLACLRSRLFLTLAWIVAASFFVLVLVVGAVVQTQESKFPNHSPFSAKAIVLCLLVIVSLRWCLRNARCDPTRNARRGVVFGTSTFGTAALTLFAIGLWVFSLGTTSGSAEHPTAQSAPATRPVTWKEVRSIIANQLHVPKERVTPDARLREDLKAKNDDVQQIISTFEKEFGIETQPPDDEVIMTAQDAFEFAQSPESFRDQVWSTR